MMPNGILKLDSGEFRSITDRQKAKLLGISPQYLCDLQQGRRRISAAIAVRLQRFGIPGEKIYLAQAAEDLMCANALLKEENK